jgi:magnesium-transporting ATPase (P-type)
LSRKQEPAAQTAEMAGIIGQIGCVTVLIIVVALGAGLFIDRYFETGNLFTILFVVGSVPITLYATVRLSLTAVARMNAPRNNAPTTAKTEEDSNT